eukprot:TRINITY_DN10224_c0_g1_i2.p1 TRINITY_DN10224_c0_g1~~TRINITY_DN10224_c0_g1_i2.p1  ORF type:complete len:399 (-),score=74.32 TRINITY_DN10224_c0_g1_i2:146-1342(-)
MADWIPSWRTLATGSAVFAGGAILLLSRARTSLKGHGPEATEHKADPGDEDYDQQLANLWGGPLPKYYNACFEEWSTKYPAPASGRGVALVTGGTGGIGFYVVKLLVKLGYEVIVPGRIGFEAEEAGVVAAVTRAVPDAKVIVPDVKLELGDLNSVRAFAADMLSKYEKLDLLCLNAGRGGAKGDPRTATVDGHEAIMQINSTSQFLLAMELLPLLEAAEAARVVSQSSGARNFAKIEKLEDMDGTDADKFNAFDQYCLSKACNGLFTKAFNERYKDSTVTAIMVDPGLACTGVNFQHDLTKSLLGFIPGLTRVMHNVAGHHAADGALPMVLAAIDPEAAADAWYTPAKDVFGPPKRGDPKAHSKANKDALNDDVYNRACRDSFWRQATAHTGFKSKM